MARAGLGEREGTASVTSTQASGHLRRSHRNLQCEPADAGARLRSRRRGHPNRGVPRLRSLRARRPRPLVTLIIPANNEAGRLPAAVRTYSSALAGRYGRAFEILVVANGCTDATAGVARAMRREVPVIRVLDIPQRIGKGGAILAGFRAARGRSVVFADADGSAEPASLLRLVDDLGRYDVSIGSRRMPASVIPRPQPLLRRMLGIAFNRVVRTAFNLRVQDTQCGAKAFRIRAARRLARTVTERGWAFDVDVLLAARQLGLTVVERSITWSDVAGSRLRVGAAAPGVAAAFWRLWQRQRAGASDVRARQRDVERPLQILALNWRCSRHPEAGGAELNLFEQARRWRERGHDVTVVSARSGGGVTLPAVEVVDGIVVRRMGGRFSIYLHVAWFLLRNGGRYDRVLDVSNGIPFFAPLFTRTPTTLLVHHVHGTQWATEFPRPIAAVGWALERYAVPAIYGRRAIIAVSPTTRDALIGIGFRPESITIVYNGVTAPRSAGALRSATRLRAPTVTYVGRIKKYKRLGLLVSAFPEVLRHVPGARLEIAGDGDDRPALEELVDELGLGDRVTLHGFVDDDKKAELLASADVFATPSMHEGWGLSVIEANAQGVPAVAFDVPGLSSAIVDGETGILAHDRDAFTSALSKILSDHDLRDRMSDAAVRWASRFDWDVSAAQTLELMTAAEPAPALARVDERVRPVA